MRSPNPDLSANERSQKSTLGHVAKRAGVSPSTVSRILNGTAKVSAAKQAAVEEAISALNFRPNPAARSLAGGRTMSVGVLTQFIDSPFYGEALRGIEDVLHVNHYVPLFVSGHWKVNEEEERLTLLQERKVDGIIVLTGKLSDDVLEEMSHQLPVVVTGRHIQLPNTHGIVFDDFRGAKLAVRHLIGLGHQRIAYISGPLDHVDAAQRLEGYKDELQAQGLPFDPGLVIESDFQESGGYKAMNSLLASRISFSGVFAANDQMAYGARLALSRAGFRVPEDISLVGFDDLPHSAFTLPPLTSVRQQVYEIGAMAATAMMSLIKGEMVAQPPVEAELIVRESTRRALR